MESNLTEETKRIWDTNAAFWDEYMGEGNHFQRLLIGPATEQLLEIEPDHQVLDIACGNGNFSRRMADLGARVVAFDFSPTFIQRAQQHSESYKDRISFQVIDATDPGQLATLGKNRFNSAVCNMALMDIPDIDPLINTLPSLLKPNGRFVFSISHPCFNSIGSSKIIEEEDREGEMITTSGIKITQYIRNTVAKGLGVIGQPEPQLYFHRPISDYLKSCIQAGFVLDGMEEPVFPGDLKHEHPFSWANFKEIPPVLIVRMRL
jgi:2-polyprenyl-3-methyl-5-hydroxy-6-metoxy-1,4-benzoquinol methylase